MAYLTSGRDKIMGSSVSTDANVVTVIDESSTDEQVPSALATKAYVDNKEVKISTEENNKIEIKDDGIFVSKDYVEITQAEYDLLTEEEKEDIVFYIKDATSDNELVTVIDENSTDDEIPSAKAVHTAIQNVSGGVTADAYTKEEVDNLLDTKVNVDDLVESYSKDETDTLLADKANTSDLVDSYSKDEVDNLLDGKANSTDIVDAYTKTEVDGLLADKVNVSSVVLTLSSANTDEEIPSAKAVHTYVDNKEVKISAEEDNKIEIKDDGIFIGKDYVEITQAEYDLLTEEEKKDIVFYITDTNINDNNNTTNIVTIIDENCTDEQVPSAKAVHDKFQEVFQSVDNGKSLIASAITDKGIDTSKDDTFETMANNINSINISGDIDSIHTAMIDLGYSFTDLDGIDSDKTAYIISKWFVLKSPTDSVNIILDVANTDTFTDWITDDEITDFGDYINPTYSATQLTISEDATSGMFVSEELTVDEGYTINEGRGN